MADFLKLPEQHDYTLATEQVDNIIEYTGGAWVFGMSREQTARSSPILRNKFAYAGLGGLTLEPYENSKPIDPLLRVTHAYKHGSLVGFDIAEMTHQGLMDYQGISNYLAAQLHAHFGDSGVDDHERAELLIEMGERGLRLPGDDVRERIEKWATQFTYSVDLRRMYTLGVGATIFAGNHIHEGYLEQVFKDVTIGLDLSGMAGDE